MQVFYQQLRSARERQSAYLRCLAGLTRARLARVRAVRIAASWGDWAPEH